MQNIKYSLAGLDFIFDEKGKPWFLEANSASTVHKELEELEGEPLTIKALAKYINSLKGENLCIFARKNLKGNMKKESPNWLAKKLEPYLKKKIHICYMKDNLRVSRNYFLDHNFIKLTLTNFNKGGGNCYLLNSSRRKVKPDIILRTYFQLNPEFEKEGVKILNPMVVRDICWMKNKCYDAVKHVKGVNIPKYFMVDDDDELRKLLKENKKLFKKGYVLKPANDSLGRGIKITNSARMPHNFEVKRGYMLQQKIKTKKINGKYFWDVRCFVINHKFIGGVKRVGAHYVTNIAQGAHGEKLDYKWKRKIQNISEKIVKALEKEAQRLAKEGYKYILTPEKPNLREVKWHPVGEE